MYRNLALAASVLIYLTNITLIGQDPLTYITIISLLYFTEIMAYIGYLKHTKLISNDLESLITDIMESYRNSKNSATNEGKKLCGECRKDKNEGYTHCYECQMCIKGRDHHCIFLDSCVNETNWHFYNSILLIQSVLCCNGMLRSFKLFSDESTAMNLWGMLVFGLNLLLGLILCSVMINNLVRAGLRRHKLKKLAMSGELHELERKVGHGFTRVTVL